MDLDSEKLNNFIIFFQTFDPQILQNEDDVETKFVIPMFEYLGYSSRYRRGKFPINTYNPNKSGRKPEADSIYFLTDDKKKQNEDTSLLLIEAKEPNKQNIENDIKQAKFYEFYTKTPFYIVTNGIHIIIYKSHHHRSDECLFNCPVDAFKNTDNATKLYKQLNFSTVKQIKQSAIDGFTNSLYVEIMQILRQKPDFLAQIERGDFTSYTFEDEQQGKVTISKPKVALECELPFVFSGGSCKIEFSNVMLRGLTCQLTHDDIVHDFLIGLNTQPHWNTRRFIHQSSDGIFVAQLGKTKVLLSEQEAEDLCSGIDFIGERYKKTLINSETLLEAWDYQFVQTFEIPGYPFLIRGFSLVSMRPWLWQLIMQFARTFSYLDGETAWHIFDAGRRSIRIITNQESLASAVLWPITEDSGGRMNNEWLNILYYDPNHEFKFYERAHKHSWRDFIGLQGIWTVKYTQEWISNCLIPKVLSYYKAHLSEHKYLPQLLQEWIAKKAVPQIFQAYSKHVEQERKKQMNKILENSLRVNKNTDIPFSKVSEFKQLGSYLRDVQESLLSYPTYWIDSTLLRPYYGTFTEIAKHIDCSTIDIGYAEGKLEFAQKMMFEDFPNKKVEDDEAQKIEQELSGYDWILHCLDKHTQRIQNTNYESSIVAELISRAFIAITEGCSNYVSQYHIKQAINAIKPLWEQYRFVDRYIRH